MGKILVELPMVLYSYLIFCLVFRVESMQDDVKNKTRFKEILRTVAMMDIYRKFFIKGSDTPAAKKAKYKIGRLLNM